MTIYKLEHGMLRNLVILKHKNMKNISYTYKFVNYRFLPSINRYTYVHNIYNTDYFF